MNINDLPPKFRAQAKEQLAAGSRDTRQDDQSESDSHYAFQKNTHTAAISAPVYLVVLCYRTAGLRWDLDNVSIKPFLDGLVEAGVLKDDSCKEIQGLITLPFKVKTKAEEHTELEFWDAGHFAKHIAAARQERL